MTYPVTVRRSQAGFTLAETLLSSVLGALMLSSLALTTFSFTNTLDYMETSAGINDDADPVLRRLTKEIREAWFVNQPDDQALEIYDNNGLKTKYWVKDGTQLWVERPNGDEGKIYGDFLDFTIDSTTVERKREADPVHHDGIFYAASATGSALSLVATGTGEGLALAFTAPQIPSDVPGQAVSPEQVTDVSMSAISLPIAFVNGSGTKKVDITLYEGWAPGKARPYSDPIASVSIDGASFPAGVFSSGQWEPPATSTSVALSATLEPGVGYTLIVKSQGSTNKVVMKAVPVVPSVDIDEVAKLTGSTWIAQPYVVPFSVSGPWTATETEVSEVVNMVTLTAYPTNRPLQQRSAAVLSQCLTDDPWLGVVLGEVAP